MTDRPHRHRQYRPSRRQVLAGLVGSSCALAGCLDGGTGDETQPQDDDSPTQTTASASGFEASVVETGLEITIDEDADISQINLIEPSGELWGRKNVAAGVSAVSLTLLDQHNSYTPGTYTVVGVNGGGTVDEVEIDLQPDVRINDVFAAEERPDLDWEEYEGWKDAIGAEVTNTGTGPEYITRLAVYRTPQFPRSDPETSAGAPIGRNVRLEPGQTVVVRDATQLFKPDYNWCQDQAPTTRSLLAVAECKVLNSNPKWTQELKYQFPEENNSCEVTEIEEGNDAAV